MFQREDHGPGQDGGAAVLLLDGGLRTPVPAAMPAGLRRAADAAARGAGRIDLVVDLGTRIGSLDWFRGLATCGALCAAALHFWPALEPIEGADAQPLPPAQWEESRALAVAPIAYGADTGRRMGATTRVLPLADTPERPEIGVTATLGLGDGFRRVLERNGVSGLDARTAADLVAQAIPLDEVKAGTRIELLLGRRAARDQPRPLERLAFRASLGLRLRIERGPAGALMLVREPIAVDDTPLRITGLVGDSLWSSARAAGAPGRAVQAYLKAIAAKLSLGRDIGADARFDLIVAQRRAATGEVETGDLLYAGLEQGRRATRLLRWTVDGREDWFDAAGTGERKAGMQMPVNGRLTSSFGLRRHPLLGFSRMHKGIDLAAPYGAPIVAAADGRVVFAGWHGGHGKFVKLDNGGGIATGYGHMSRFAVSPGTRVRQGEVIGYVGSTGLSTGPHLHYELYRNNAAVDPRGVKFATVQAIAGAELARFRAALARLMAVPTGRGGAKVQTAQARAKAAS